MNTIIFTLAIIWTLISVRLLMKEACFQGNKLPNQWLVWTHYVLMLIFWALYHWLSH